MTSRAAAVIDLGSLVLLACGLAAVAAGSGPVRTVLVLAAAISVPGWALLTLLPATDLLTAVALSVAFSLALEIAGSLVLGWVGWWHPFVLAGVLCGASAVALLRHLVRTVRASRAEGGPWFL
jgi:uncharacterized membrane protein